MKTYKVNPAVVIANFQAETSTKNVNKLSSFDFNCEVDKLEDVFENRDLAWDYFFENTRVRFFVTGSPDNFIPTYSIGWWSKRTNQYEWADSESCEIDDIKELFNIEALKLSQVRGMCQYDRSYDENDCYCPLFIEQ